VNPNEEYDEAVRGFVHRLLPDAVDDPFLVDLMALQGMVAFFGYFNSLAQVLLKMACPGVPDLYQGTELWDFSLVDPDNRRPVDYPLRLRALEELRNHAEPDRQQLISKLLAHPSDGRIKLFLIYQMLNFRRACATLFESGDYLPLEAAGTKRDHVCAFARAAGDQVVLVAVPRLVFRLAGGIKQAPLGPEIWEKTRLLLPPHLAGRPYRNILTSEVHSLAAEGTPDFYLGAIFGQFPVAVLYSGPEEVECSGAAPKARPSKRKKIPERRGLNA
jgi:(1->4)-alpha-D-glucan 1-alpha-D-glucosylmutase